MPARKGRTPKLCHHKGIEKGYVTVAGKERYFQGRWPRKQKTPPAAIYQQYQRWCQQWEAARAEMPQPVTSDPSIEELWLGYRRFAETYYQKRGKQTAEVGNIVAACRVVARLYGRLLAREFGPLKLKEVRAEFVKMGWTRRSINKQISRVRRMFRWAAENELVPVTVHQALQAVRDLAKGRSPAKEGKGIKAVAWPVVRATLRHLARPLPALVRVHYLLGCRAQDVLIMRACDINRTADPAGQLWAWTPADEQGVTWKTEHHEDAVPLVYWIGPRAQRLLRKLIDWDRPADWVFSTKGKKGNGRRTGRYTTITYRRAIDRGIDRANRERAQRGLPELPHWSPLQLRHARLTKVRAHGGLEAAQAVAQHQQLSTTEIYAERHGELARRAMREIG